MPNPTVWPGAKSFLSLGVEAVQGTPVTPTWTYPVEAFEPEDKPVYIDDTSQYGDMAKLHGSAQGPIHSEWTLKGPYFGDGAGFLLHNVLGDLVEDGVYTGAGTTTLSSGASAGATTISTVASIAATTVIAIDAGSTTLAEVRTVSSVSGAGPYTVTLNRALSFAHSSAVTVRPITTPYTHLHSLLNTGTGQPGSVAGLGGSLTLVDWQGLTATTLARAYTGCCASELMLKGNPESEFVSMEAKGLGWLSAAAGALPVAAPTTAQPMAAWRVRLGLAGPATGGTLVKTIGDWELTFKRQLKALFTSQNSQNPFLIQRGEVEVSGKVTVLTPADETHLTYMLANTQPQLQLIVDNGGAGAALLNLQVDVQKAAYKTVKIKKSEAIGQDVTFDAIATSTNAGQSAGTSPVKVTIQNAVNQLY